MLRQRKRKMSKKKSQKGGLWPFGPVFGSHVSTAGEDAKKGWFHFTTGLKKTEEVGRQAKQDYTAAYQQQRHSMGGLPPKDTHSDLAIRAMENLSIKNQGHLAPQVAAQYRDAGEGSQRTTSENPLTSSPVHTGHVRHSGNLTPRQIHFGGKRKTKKRRRKRKKKKTKRKKRRRKRKTKKRRKKYN